MKKTWKLYLYYNGILIKKVRIKEDEIDINTDGTILAQLKTQLKTAKKQIEKDTKQFEWL